MAPAAVIVMSVVYVPAVSPAIDGVTVSVPPADETLSHDAISDADHASEPADTSSVFAAGAEPPWVAVNDRLDGETVSVGTGGGPLQVTEVVMSDWSAGAASARL